MTDAVSWLYRVPCFRFSGQLYALVGDDDEVSLIEVADGPFVGLLAHLELSFDVLGIALVAQVAAAAMVFEPLQQRLGKVGGQLTARGL